MNWDLNTVLCDACLTLVEEHTKAWAGEAGLRGFITPDQLCRKCAAKVDEWAKSTRCWWITASILSSSGE